MHAACATSARHSCRQFYGLYYVCACERLCALPPSMQQSNSAMRACCLCLPAHCCMMPYAAFHGAVQCCRQRAAGSMGVAGCCVGCVCWEASWHPNHVCNCSSSTKQTCSLCLHAHSKGSLKPYLGVHHQGSVRDTVPCGLGCRCEVRDQSTRLLLLGIEIDPGGHPGGKRAAGACHSEAGFSTQH